MNACCAEEGVIAGLFGEVRMFEVNRKIFGSPQARQANRILT